MPSFCASNFWTGTWNLNEAKSSPQGASYSLTMSAQGEFKITNTSFTYRFRCDGKDYPTVAEDSVVCSHADAAQMDMTSKRSGKILASRHLELSADGKTTISHITVLDPNGSKEVKTRVYERVGSSTGLAGIWIDAERENIDPKVMETVLTASTFTVVFPDQKQHTDMNLDGTDAKIQGLPPGSKVTIAVKLEGPTRMLTVQKIDGVVVKQGTLQVSADGNTLIQETWRPGEPSVMRRLVFERQ
jgi:hypothetical protein